eukprot:gene7937-biopygen13626
MCDGQRSTVHSVFLQVQRHVRCVIGFQRPTLHLFRWFLTFTAPPWRREESHHGTAKPPFPPTGRAQPVRDARCEATISHRSNDALGAHDCQGDEGEPHRLAHAGPGRPARRALRAPPGRNGTARGRRALFSPIQIVRPAPGARSRQFLPEPRGPLRFRRRQVPKALGAIRRRPGPPGVVWGRRHRLAGRQAIERPAGRADGAVGRAGGGAGRADGGTGRAGGAAGRAERPAGRTERPAGHMERTERPARRAVPHCAVVRCAPPRLPALPALPGFHVLPASLAHCAALRRAAVAHCA